MVGMKAIFAKSLRDHCWKTNITNQFIPTLGHPRLAMNPASTLSPNLPLMKHITSVWPLQHMEGNTGRLSLLSSCFGTWTSRTDGRTFSTALPVDNQSIKNMVKFRYISSPTSLIKMFHHRTYSSHSGSKQDDFQISVTNGANAELLNSGNTDPATIDWSGMLDRACQSVVDIAFDAEKKAKDLYNDVTPYLQELYNSQPYLEKVIVPVTGTVSATLIAWFVMPRILRKLHKYCSQGPIGLLSESSTIQQDSYEKSLWAALEDPAKYFITFVAFSQLGIMIVYRGTMIAPTAIEYLLHAWSWAFVLSFIWFLRRWYTNFFSTALMTQTVVVLDQDKLLTLGKVSYLGLITLEVMALADALGVPGQSIVTIGAIGGVAITYAARDMLANLLSGRSLQFSKPFGVGDNIKDGSVEGQVIEMGLATTTLINRKKFHVMIPNSFFSSQDIEKIPLIFKEINCMLKGYPKVFLGKDAPYCYISRIEQSFAELILECNLKSMGRDELLAAEQDILLQAVRIIRKHSAELGSNLNDQKNF